MRLSKKTVLCRNSYLREMKKKKTHEENILRPQAPSPVVKNKVEETRKMNGA